MWSHRYAWNELVEPADGFDDIREVLDLRRDWVRLWTATWRYAGSEVGCPVRDLSSMPVTGCAPVRRFSWRRGQRHRSGLQSLASTGRHHGFESSEEARLLLVLDFAAELVDVLSQPFRLRFSADGGWHVHTPDFLAYTRNGQWLIDARPAPRVCGEDRVAFGAAAEVAAMLGWRYVLVTGWKPHVVTTLDTLSAQRWRLSDRLGLVDVLLDALTGGPRPFAGLAEWTVPPAVARAYLLHLLWHRRLGMDLAHPLGDRTLVCLGKAAR